MIYSLTGIVATTRKQSITLVLDQVGVDILVPDESLFRAEKKQTIYVYLHWNQEQGPSLYGFAEELDKKVFLLIISCSGIGPRIGLAVISDLGAKGFLGAVYEGNEKLLSKVSGIGVKKAEQMIVQLKHKVHQLLRSGVSLDGGVDHTQWNLVAEALQALSYSRTEITQAVNFIRNKNGVEANQGFDQLLRQALLFLSKQQ